MSQINANLGKKLELSQKNAGLVNIYFFFFFVWVIDFFFMAQSNTNVAQYSTIIQISKVEKCRAKILFF